MTRAAKREPLFASEADLCAAFIAAVAGDAKLRRRNGQQPPEWVAYAETCGWDILLVRVSDGFQIGIEAKLRFNVEVLNQAIEGGWIYRITDPGPDCRAVLVPDDAKADLGTIAKALGITVIRVRVLTKDERRWNSAFHPSLPDEQHRFGDDEWFERMPSQRCLLPEYVPDVAAGASAPLQLTAWKIAAMKIAITLETRGFVTRVDFKHHGIDHRRWIDGGWLQPGEKGWVRGGFPDFKAQHPRVYAEIAAKAAEWMSPNGGLLL